MPEAKKYTFEQLKNMSDKELDKAKMKMLDKLCDREQQRWTKIAAILFYQNELEKK